MSLNLDLTHVMYMPTEQYCIKGRETDLYKIRYLQLVMMIAAAVAVTWLMCCWTAVQGGPQLKHQVIALNKLVGATVSAMSAAGAQQ